MERKEMYNRIDLTDKARPMICEVCTRSENNDGKNPEHWCNKEYRPFIGKQWIDDNKVEPDPTGKHYLCHYFKYGNWG